MSAARAFARLLALLGAALLWAAVTAPPAVAQPSSLLVPSGPPVSNSQPVTFIANRITYDRTTGIVTATGHVQAWQNDRVLEADRITYNRNTGITIATGHVVVVEPDGQVLFADRARLTDGMQNAVLTGMSVRLAENGRLIANGGQRTGGKVNELARAVYSTCNLCAKHPEAPPLWQITGSKIVQDLVNKRIEYLRRDDAHLRLPDLLFPLFLDRRSLGEARERPARPLVRHRDAPGRVPHRPLLLCDRQPVRRRHLAHARHPGGRPSRGRLSAGLQQRRGPSQRVSRR